jgi:CRISPR system Cascade subunit CasD
MAAGPDRDMLPHLLLRLEAPLMSFGTVAVDQHRPVQLWPATSLLTGLLANALGWRREQAAALDRLQSRVRWAVRIDRAGVALEDFQTAKLAADDRGWTTRGRIEERAGGPATYRSPHIRRRHFRADASVLVALRLEPADEFPALDALEAALRRPARPLFIGRKGCLPAVPMLAGRIVAADAMQALDVASGDAVASRSAALFVGPDAATVPSEPSLEQGWRVHEASDERRFSMDVHAGKQRVLERLRRESP